MGNKKSLKKASYALRLKLNYLIIYKKIMTKKQNLIYNYTNPTN